MKPRKSHVEAMWRQKSMGHKRADSRGASSSLTRPELVRRRKAVKFVTENLSLRFQMC